MKKISQIQSDFLARLAGIYDEREAKHLFLIASYFIDGFNSKDILLDSSSENADQYTSCLNSLVKSIPIQYHFGKAEFDDLLFKVNPSVLIPRPETLELVMWVEEELHKQQLSICDIGTGSGCIAISLAKRLPQAVISACDKYAEALEIAMENSQTIGAEVKFFHCDILNEEIANFDVLVSNPPYIPMKEQQKMSAIVLQNEPHTALFVEDHRPLLFYERIIALAQKNHSLCFFEIHEDLKVELEQMLHTFGLKYEFKRDMQGKFRMLKVQA